MRPSCPITPSSRFTSTDVRITRPASTDGAHQVMHKPFELHDLAPLLLKAFASSRS